MFGRLPQYRIPAQSKLSLLAALVGINSSFALVHLLHSHEHGLCLLHSNDVLYPRAAY